MLIKEQYFTLKDICTYVAQQQDDADLTDVTFLMLYNTLNTYSSTFNTDLTTFLNSVFNEYVLPQYLNNSCFKIETRVDYIGSSDLEVDDVLNDDEMFNFVNRLKAFSYNIQSLYDRYIKYAALIPNTANGKKKATTAVLKNNDTPQISGSGDTQNDGFVNNIQINSGTETDTLSITEQLDALKFIEDIKYECATLFRNQVLID